MPQLFAGEGGAETPPPSSYPVPTPSLFAALDLPLGAVWSHGGKLVWPWAGGQGRRAGPAVQSCWECLFRDRVGKGRGWLGPVGG